MTASEMLDAALEYAAKGWPVFPLTGKDPLTPHGVKDASTDEDQIRAWWTAHPSANVGMACGEASAVVVDDDGPLSKAAIAEYVRVHGIDTAEGDLSTVGVETRKGTHLYFAWAEGCEKLKNWTKIIPDTDIRTTGGYVVVPPSIHPDSGAAYEWIVSPDNGNLRPFPSWLLKFLIDSEATKKAAKRSEKLEKITTTANRQKVARMKADEGHPYGRRALEDEIATLRATPEGERNNQLNESAIKLFGLCKAGVLDRSEAERGLTRAARSIGLTDSEAEKTLESAWSGATVRVIPVGDQGQMAGCSICVEGDEGEKKSCGPSMATRIVDLALSSGATFWKSPEGEAFATVPNAAGHNENHPLKSKAVKNWLSGLLYHEEGRVPKGSAVADALAVLEGKATFEGATYPVFVRLAEYAGKFYLDLGGEDWRAAEIGPYGWRVISSEDVPVKFRRAKGIIELPEPTKGGDLEDLRRVLNIPEGASWVLVRAWLVQAFKPTGPYPPLIVDGEQGSGKSWLGRILRYLIDPNKSPLRRPPRNDHEMMIAATNGWLVVYDNLSGLPKWLGDALCVVSTGGGMSTRELYTDSDEALFDIQRPIILNGIDALTTRGDLLGRAILLHLPRIEDGARMTEKAIKAELDRIRPGVLGAILDVVSYGLGTLPDVKLDSMPRMADFAEWVTACEGALGWEPGAFLEAFEENQRESKLALIENDMFAVSLVEFMEGTEEPFEDTVGFLLTALEERSGVTVHNRPDGWPKTARGARNSITRIMPALRDLGLEVTFRTGHGHVRLIRIERHTAPQKGSTATTATKKPASGGDGGDGGDHFLNSTPRVKKEEEGKERGREGKDRKSPPLTPPPPQHSGNLVAVGGGGGRLGGGTPPEGDVNPSLSLAGFKEILQRRGLDEITAPILASDQGIPETAAKIQLDRAAKCYGLTKRRVGFDDFYRLPEEASA